MITRVSRKLEIQFNFRKFPDQPYILGWLSVSVPAKDKEFGQKGTFQLTAEGGKVWDEPTVRRLEELSVESDALRQAWEECERSPPAPVHSVEERERWLSGKDPRAKAMLERYFTGSDDNQNLKWLKQCGDAKQAYAETLVELDSFAVEMANQDIVLALLNQVIPLESGTADERVYALYRSAVWCSDRDLTPEQWQVLIDRFVEREDAELAAALSPVALGESTRERIPPEVRRAVWIRDQGKCARCGSRERLEYDHIVPVSRGGSNTERNIELLCEFHNRAKSNTIS